MKHLKVLLGITAIWWSVDTFAAEAGAAEEWANTMLATYGGHRAIPETPDYKQARTDLRTVPENAQNWVGHYMHVLFAPVVEKPEWKGVTFSMPEVLSAFSVLSRNERRRHWFQEACEVLQLQGSPEVYRKRPIVVGASKIQKQKRAAFFDIMKTIPLEFRPQCASRVLPILVEISPEKVNKFYSKFLEFIKQLEEDKQQRPEVVGEVKWELYDEIVKQAYNLMDQPRPVPYL